MANDRPRFEIIEELEDLYLQLQQKHGKILLDEMAKLVKEFGRANRQRAAQDGSLKAATMREEYLQWASRHQVFLDKESDVSRAWAAAPKETPVAFTGDNIRAFWNHLNSSVVNNPALNARQKMAHFVSRVKDQKDAAALVAAFPADGTELGACLAAFEAQYLDEKLLQVEALKRADKVKSLTDLNDQVAVSAFLTEVRVIQTHLRANSGSRDQHLDVAKAIVCKLPEHARSRLYSKLAKRNAEDTVEASEGSSFLSKGSDKQKETPILECLIELLEHAQKAAGWRRFLEGGPGERSPSKRREEDNDNRFPHKRIHRRVMLTAKPECLVCQATDHDVTSCTAKTAEERFRILRVAGWCLKCLKHRYDPRKPCQQSRPCKYCGLQHHSVVCRQQSSRQVNSIVIEKAVESPVLTTSTAGALSRVYMSVVSALLLTDNKATNVRVLLDSAAETTLITMPTVSRANLKPTPAEPLSLIGVTDGRRRTDRVVQLTLASTDRSFQAELTAYVTPIITSNRLKAPTEELQQKAKEKGVALALDSIDGNRIDLLIGQDWLFPFLANRIVPLGPFIGALHSPLGWYIAGREGGTAVRGTAAQLVCQELCQDLARIYDYIEPEEMKLMEESGQKTAITYDQTRGKYSVTLPRKSLAGLGDNRKNSWAQVMALKRKLLSSGRYDEYDRAIKEYIVNGFAETAPKLNPGQQSYTIPHHAVWKKDAEKTKCRIVFNASSNVPGQHSLNQCLSKGESINADIWGITLRFRLAPIVLVTDLVKAFSQIEVDPADRDLQRYFWFEKPEDEQPKEYRMKRVIFGAVSSPYLLGAVLREHTRRFGEEFPEVAEQMDAALYMDDCFLVADTVEQAEKLMDQAEAFFSKASFELHPWLSNETVIEKPGRSVGDNDAEHKSLGLRWRPRLNTFQVRPVESIYDEAAVKRRKALSLLAQFYDPLSVFGPLKTRIRLFIRDLATTKVDWDAELTAAERKRLARLLKELAQAAEISIPRNLVRGGPLELHVFGDASAQAYGAVAYLIHRASDERMMLGAKLKLAPKKFLVKAQEERGKVAPPATMPRLELMAAVMAARLVTSILLHLPQQTPVALYTDSDITLKRIQGDLNKQEPFEMRRLQAILDLTDVGQWHHISTDQNPADLLTRDVSTRKWLEKPLWWNGPATAWPAASATTFRRVCIAQTPGLTPKEKDICASSFEEALRKMKEVVEQEGSTLDGLNEDKKRPLDQDSYVRMRLWSLVQRELFAPDLDRLRAGLLPGERSPLRLLDPFLDEWGVLRSRRPAQPQTVDWAARHPMILSQHALVRQMVRREHEALGHAGEATTRSHLAQYYHLVRGRRLIKGVIRPCRQCNIQRGKPFRPPEPTLPPFRTDYQARPFSYIGLDHFGPLKVKGASKVYGLMFTCAVTRAVHIEVVTSLSGPHCINALKRFFARRGVPLEIHSDNGRSFVASNRALSKLAALVEEAPTHAVFERHQIKWVFQTPRAPWFGAFFERMIGVSKRVLEQTNINKASNLDDIRTIVTQVEAIVNSRPLIEADEEGHVALTPAHFLIGTSLLALPPYPSSANLPDPNHLLRHYQAICETRTQLQARLQKEYLVELRKHHRIHNPTRSPAVGEWVLVSGEETLGQDRFGWPVEQIKELLPDADGHVRKVRISWRGGLRERPVRSLIPLEGLQSTPADPEPPPSPAAGARECGERDTTRPSRRSSRLAK